MLPEDVPADPGEDGTPPEESRLKRWWRRLRRHTSETRKEAREASDPTDGGCEWGCDWIDGCETCDGCDACSGCDLMRLSTVLLAVAALTPPAASGSTAVAALRFYRRRLTRWTPRCPSTPSCSAYALAAVEELGPRRGLAAAARRVRDCGR
ncbi:hemolytic domain-containing protein [Pseudonocardia sediminis]|uniref:Hemolytic domain-containing protein n=1 Tax=Pseudonocardia sediminis TaxID=1397368 RepID=A0A4Q7UVW3_PSEST|nr:membrane protein insertion efficiency factor YidD [Pseudonocardia sediminis]RZT84273.1 hemolytic domain-containing protein [Pseudonocardia sediminis]